VGKTIVLHTGLRANPQRVFLEVDAEIVFVEVPKPKLETVPQPPDTIEDVIALARSNDVAAVRDALHAHPWWYIDNWQSIFSHWGQMTERVKQATELRYKAACTIHEATVEKLKTHIDESYLPTFVMQRSKMFIPMAGATQGLFGVHETLDEILVLLGVKTVFDKQ